MQNKEYLCYIDKTGNLEEGIKRFPSVYIEGNAATGKTTAVQMLAEKYSQIEKHVLDLLKELKNPEELLRKLSVIQKQLQAKGTWLILENMPSHIEKPVADCIVEMIQKIENESKVFLISREKPQEEFLGLLWKGQMELFPMEKLLLSLDEVRTLAAQMGITQKTTMVHEKTGGWSGCVNLLLRLIKNDQNMQMKDEEALLNSYEMRTYIQKEMISQLGDQERKLLEYCAGCPWVTEEMCNELWQIPKALDILENLYRKGFLIFDFEKKYWKAAPLFVRYIHPIHSNQGREALWYESKGYIAETLWCLDYIGDRKAYQECVLRHYDKIYGLGLLTEEVLQWSEENPIVSYLKGAYYYSIQEFEGLKKEILKLEKIKEKTPQVKELIMNLNYLNQDVSLNEWLDLLEDYEKNGRKLHLYQMIGNSVTYLCGIRDLTGLFACEKKEEKRRANLWKQVLGELEWKSYQFAKLDYYLETERKELLKEEDWEILGAKDEKQELWQFRMAKLYMLCKIQRMQPEDSRIQRIYELEESLKKENHPICAQMAEAISSIYAPWYGAREKMAKWLRYNVLDNMVAINETNFLLFYCRAKACIFLNQYERAEKILKKLIPYMQKYSRQRFVAELRFQYAVVNWGKELKGQAVRNAIESFLISQNSRYVSFYAVYGQKGVQVLEALVEWQQASIPEGWSRKKKYNYGNVLTMPIEDYMQVILRTTKKASRQGNKFPEEYIEEHLTMMETIILQDIGRGMNNSEICLELGVKMPTVKGHIYSIYKKLGVKNRMQAVLKGKELGVLE